MALHHTIHHHLIPSHHNAYRPHLLRREALIFFLIAMLLIEGFFVADMLVKQSVANFVAAVGITAAPTPASPSFLNSIERQIVKVVTDPRSATMWALSSLLMVLSLALACTFFFHLHIQPMELLTPGALVAGMMVMFIFLNTHFFGVA